MVDLVRLRTAEGEALIASLTDEQLALPTRPARARGQVLADTIRLVLIGHYHEVTEFGRPVAVLGPLPSRRPTWAQLVASGRLTPPANPDTRTMPPRRPPATVFAASEVLLAERRADDR